MIARRDSQGADAMTDALGPGKSLLAISMVAVLVCGAAAPGHKQAAKANEPPAPTAAPANAVPAPKLPKPYVYPYACDRPLSAQQDNLCIQRRVAETADKWGRLTFRVGLAIAVGLFLTFLATAAAAWAAARSANAAEWSARASAKALAKANFAPGPAQEPPKPAPPARPRQRQ
jgi:hypothetical protein